LALIPARQAGDSDLPGLERVLENTTPLNPVGTWPCAGNKKTSKRFLEFMITFLAWPHGVSLRPPAARARAQLAGLSEFMSIPRQWQSRPGASAGIPERPGAQPASRQQAAYRCARGHAFTVALAAGIEPPATWGCRCGAPARAAGSTDPGKRQTEHDRCMAVLLRRRTRADLEQLLAERLADTAQQRDRPGHPAR
jgi:hypothetical protein